MKRCTFCWRPQIEEQPEQHNDGCPVTDPTLQSEWDKGYSIGFDGEILVWRELRHYSETFQYGYRAGRYNIEQLVYEAVIN